MNRVTTTRRRWGCLLTLTGLLACRLAWAAVPEYDLKAALIYKIGKFVRWPEGTAGAGLTICVIGKDDFGTSIDGLNGQKLQGRTITVARMIESDSLASACQIAFVSRAARAHLDEILGALAHAPVLTISDIEGFAAAGGMVELVTTDSKIHFQINPGAGRRAGVDIGAQLLQLATLIADDHLPVKP